MGRSLWAWVSAQTGATPSGQARIRQHPPTTPEDLRGNLPGVKQIYIGVNEMNFDTIGYTQLRYDEIASEMKNMFAQVG